jgi:site-specific DNA recombinase
MLHTNGRGERRPLGAVVYARVSSKDQEKEGFSIPAQLRLLGDYARTKRFVIVEEFIDVETAKVSGRTKFNEMLLYLKKHPKSCRTILVEKTDRLYRNIKDYATIDELDVEVHFVKENEIISRSSRSNEQFVHGIKVLMARNYSQNLGEETIKGMTEKARAGIYPSSAPVGYQNSDGPNGKRIILPDPDEAPTIALVFERYISGKFSIKELAARLNAEGVKLCGRKFHNSTLHQILRKRLYSGDFDWNGTTFSGTHEPLVTRELWQRAQVLLDVRAEKKTRKVKHDFAYTGLVHCGHCGCLMVGELKKNRYVYYHCTGNRGKCPERYTPQEKLTGEFSSILRDLVIPRPVLDWLGDALLESDRTEHAARHQAIKRLRVRHEQIEARIETMYTDKLDGRITQEQFDRRSGDCRREQEAILAKIRHIEQTAPAPIGQAIDMMGLMSRASELFLEQPAAEKRRLLQVVVEKAAWKGGQLQTALFEPFEILRCSNRESSRKEKENAGSGCVSEIWLLG